jgi:hypothetical protein
MLLDGGTQAFTIYHLPHVDDVEAKVLKAVGNIVRWRIWEVMDYCFYRLFGIRGEGKIVEIIFLQVGFHG